MRHNLMRALAGAGMVAAALLVGAPTRAAQTTSDGAGGLTVSQPQWSATAPAWVDPGDARAPLSETQRMTERVDSMAHMLDQDAGAIHPGEDFLGSGTSLTH